MQLGPFCRKLQEFVPGTVEKDQRYLSYDKSHCASWLSLYGVQMQLQPQASHPHPRSSKQDKASSQEVLSFTIKMGEGESFPKFPSTLSSVHCVLWPCSAARKAGKKVAGLSTSVEEAGFNCHRRRWDHGCSCDDRVCT